AFCVERGGYCFVRGPLILDPPLEHPYHRFECLACLSMLLDPMLVMDTREVLTFPCLTKGVNGNGVLIITPDSHSRYYIGLPFSIYLDTLISIGGLAPKSWRCF